MKYMRGREHNYEYIFSRELSVTLYIKHQSYEINPYPYEFETSVRSELLLLLLAQHSSKQIAQSFAQTKSLNRKYLLPIYDGITPTNKRCLKFRITVEGKQEKDCVGSFTTTVGTLLMLLEKKAQLLAAAKVLKIETMVQMMDHLNRNGLP